MPIQFDVRCDGPGGRGTLAGAVSRRRNERVANRANGGILGGPRELRARRRYSGCIGRTKAKVGSNESSFHRPCPVSGEVPRSGVREDPRDRERRVTNSSRPGRGVIYHPASLIVPQPIRSVQSAGWCRIDGNSLAYRPVAFARAEVVWFGRERARTAGPLGPIFGLEVVPRGMVR